MDSIVNTLKHTVGNSDVSMTPFDLQDSSDESSGTSEEMPNMWDPQRNEHDTQGSDEEENEQNVESQRNQRFWVDCICGKTRTMTTERCTCDRNLYWTRRKYTILRDTEYLNDESRNAAIEIAKE